jgi:HD-GYP domain-containing protein (c-di-GMP phosphodiesterase class II)
MEEALEIRKVPLMSLDTLLSRKIGLDENLRAILLGVYERADGKGYPKGVLQDKLTIESQLVRFAKEFDQRTKLDPGGVRLSPQDVLRGMLHEPELKAIFSPKFIELISTKLLASDILRP